MTDEVRTSIAPTQEMQWELMYALSPDDPGGSRVLIVDNRYLDGPLDQSVMRDAFAAVAVRHDALRLTFDTVAPDPTVLIKSGIEPPVEFLDLSALPENKQLERIDEVVFEENRRCFDLRSPLWHAWVVRLGPESHLLNVSFSHVIADGASCDVFAQDLLAAYNAQLGRHPAWMTDVPSFVEIHTMQSQRLAARTDQLDYWRQQLAPVPQNPAFVRDAPPAADLLARARIPFTIPAATATELKRIAWRTSTTPFVVTLAVYHLLLSLVAEKDRTVIASGTFARPTTGEKRSLMQFVTDTYICADTPDGASLREIVRRAHESMTKGIENLLAFKAIARVVNPGFDSARPWPDYNLCDGHFYSGASYSPAPEDSQLQLRHASITGKSTLDRASDLVAGHLTPPLDEAWDAWCRPSVAMGNPRHGGVLLYNDRIYPTKLMRRFVDHYLWIVDTLAWSPETKVGDLREGYARRRGLTG